MKGVVEPPKLVDFINKKTRKHVAIVKVEPEKKEDDKAKEGKEEKKGGEKDAKKAEDGGKEGKESGGGGGAGADAGGGDQAGAKQDQVGEGEGDAKLEMKKSELAYYYYPPMYPQNYHHQHYQQAFVHQEYHGYPAYAPQIFSDENPNACSVM